MKQLYETKSLLITCHLLTSLFLISCDKTQSEDTFYQDEISEEVTQHLEGSNNVQVSGSNNIVNLPATVTKPSELYASVSVSTENRVCDEMDKDFLECGENQKKLDYLLTETDEKIRIYPNMEKVISPVEMFWSTNIGLRYPKLDFKVVNNTNETFFIDSIELEKINSAIDKNVYLHTAMECSSQELSVINHNRFSYEDEDYINKQLIKSDPIIEYTVNFNDNISTRKQFNLSDNFENVSNGKFTVDILNSLKEVGIKSDEIKRIAEKYDYALHKIITINSDCEGENDYAMCKPEEKSRIIKNAEKSIDDLSDIGIHTDLNSLLNYYSNGFKHPSIDGILKYRIYDYETKEYKAVEVPFSEEILIFEGFECGDSLPPSATYTTKLKTNGQNYRTQIPISQSIRPGDVDRFELTLGVDEASFHTFTPILKTVNGKDKKLKDIEIYIP